MWFPLLTRNPLYTKLDTSIEAEEKDYETTRKVESKTMWNVLSFLMISIASGTLGFVFARILERRSVVSAPAGPKFTKQLTTFSYNRDFSYPPSNTTEIAWNGLFPGKGSGGFFNHPYTGGERATLSVLHQLHCLDGMRHIYYLNNDAAITGQLLSEEDLEPHMKRSHMRHCIDFLRQSLMCCGDTSIEKVDSELKGVTGWGTVHMCTNWEELQEWVEERLRLDHERRVVETENVQI